MRLLVCGGRDFTDGDLLNRTLTSSNIHHPFSVLIHGNARGTDSMAHNWAIKNNIPVQVYPAQWGKYGRRAGYLRNKQMLEEGKPDVVLAFPGGRGTQDMIQQAHAYGVTVIRAAPR